MAQSQSNNLKAQLNQIKNTRTKENLPSPNFRPLVHTRRRNNRQINLDQDKEEFKNSLHLQSQSSLALEPLHAPHCSHYLHLQARPSSFRGSPEPSSEHSLTPLSSLAPMRLKSTIACSNSPSLTNPSASISKEIEVKIVSCFFSFLRWGFVDSEMKRGKRGSREEGLIRCLRNIYYTTGVCFPIPLKIGPQLLQ